MRQFFEEYPQDLIVKLHRRQKSEKPCGSVALEPSINAHDTFKGSQNLLKDHRLILVMLF